MTIYAPCNARANAPIHKMSDDPLTILCNRRTTIDSVVCTDQSSKVTCKNCLRILEVPLGRTIE